MREVDRAEKLQRQARACAALGSPFTEGLLFAAAADYRAGHPVRTLVDAHPHLNRPGLHLAGALHYLALEGEPSLAAHYPSVGGDGDPQLAWNAARDLLREDPTRIERLFVRIPQTNEPARSMPLLAAFAAIAAQFQKPLRIFEVGASAGLNLLFDRFGYDGGDWTWGNLTSPLVLRNRTAAGCPSHLDARIEIAERGGCDLNPLDATSKADRLRLQSFVWPDQTERLDRLRHALEAARPAQVRIDAEDFLTWIPREARCRDGSVTVLVHTMVEEHLSKAGRAALRETIATQARCASPSAPLARVRMELDGHDYQTEVFSWPNGNEPTPLCRADGHAQDIVWARRHAERSSNRIS